MKKNFIKTVFLFLVSVFSFMNLSAQSTDFDGPMMKIVKLTTGGEMECHEVETFNDSLGVSYTKIIYNLIIMEPKKEIIHKQRIIIFPTKFIESVKELTVIERLELDEKFRYLKK